MKWSTTTNGESRITEISYEFYSYIWTSEELFSQRHGVYKWTYAFLLLFLFRDSNRQIGFVLLTIHDQWFDGNR